MQNRAILHRLVNQWFAGRFSLRLSGLHPLIIGTNFALAIGQQPPAAQVTKFYFGAEIPVYGEYTEAFDAELKPYIDRLCAAHGEIECRQAFELARQLNRECAEIAALSQSRVYENLSFRANVIAYLKACVLYVANGCQWDDTFETFIRWSLQYDMWCKMEFFGHGILSADQVVESGTHPGPQGLFSLLPEFFTKDDALRVRRMFGLGEDRKNNMISTWKKRNYILQMADGSYQNLKFKKKE